MPSLKEVRTRITSVSSTSQITSAMKMVSAAKLRRAQDAILQMRPYAQKLQELLWNLSAALEGDASSPYAETNSSNRVLLVVITSNRGLCGAFNTNVIKAANQQIRTVYAEQMKAGEVDVITVGKKASDIFRKATHVKHIGRQDHLYDELDFAHVAPLAEEIMKDYAAGKYGKVELVYNQFRNAASQVIQKEPFLPATPPEAEGASSEKFSIDYIFEPGKEEIVRDLIPKSLKTQLYKALLDSHAAEHGARMTAMHKATDNAKELLKELKLTYNKARQAAITTEILEIVGGAEALNN
ncbi:MAG: ATP synthase F1 subunit gamma [Flavobacteriales bacterium]|nr:ATP synthase F1 subunit gamma [Flavobacteriales bacterium]